MVVAVRLLPVSVLVIAFVSAACGGVDVREKTGQPSASTPGPSGFSLPFGYSQNVAAQGADAKFSVRYNQSDYHAIYLMLDQSYRSQVSEEQLTDLAKMRQRLGTWGRTRERTHETTPLGDGGDVLVTFLMDSTFEKGSGLQTFRWRVTPSNVTYLMRYQFE
jgi:hypothetical protein